MSILEGMQRGFGDISCCGDCVFGAEYWVLGGCEKVFLRVTGTEWLQASRMQTGEEC